MGVGEGAARNHLNIHRVGFGLLAALSISVTNIFTFLHYEAGSNPVTFLLGRYVLFAGVLGAWLLATGRLRALAPGAPRAPVGRGAC